MLPISEADCIPCNRLDYALAGLHQHPCVRNITVEQVLEAVEGDKSAKSIQAMVVGFALQLRSL